MLVWVRSRDQLDERVEAHTLRQVTQKSARFHLVSLQATRSAALCLPPTFDSLAHPLFFRRTLTRASQQAHRPHTRPSVQSTQLAPAGRLCSSSARLSPAAHTRISLNSPLLVCSPHALYRPCLIDRSLASCPSSRPSPARHPKKFLKEPSTLAERPVPRAPSAPPPLLYTPTRRK